MAESAGLTEESVATIKSLQRGGKFDMALWLEKGIDYITNSEGKVSMLMAYIDNCGQDKPVHPDAVRLIIEAGVDVKHCNKDGENALFAACMRPTMDEAWQVMIAAGVDCTVVADNDIMTEYLQQADGRGFEKSDAVCKMFKDGGLTEEMLTGEEGKAKWPEV